MSKENIYPTFDKLIERKEKERKLGQNSCVLWFTGLSGSGKTTIAAALERKLFDEGFVCQVLDGDNIRSGLNSNLGFDESSREENIRRIAEVAKLFVEAGIITICCFVSPTNSLRRLASEIIGTGDYNEVYVKAELSVCEGRDVKGLYKKARAGEINDFTGISSPFEEPESPAIVVESGHLSIEDCVAKIVENIYPIIKNK